MKTPRDKDFDLPKSAEILAMQAERTTGGIPADMPMESLNEIHSTWEASPVLINGFEILPIAARLVTAELVQTLMEESERT
jgi:hypothetical protein